MSVVMNKTTDGTVSTALRKYVAFTHVYWDVHFGIYPVSELYTIGDYPEYEVRGMWVCFDEETKRIGFEGVLEDELFEITKNDLKDLDTLQKDIEYWLWYGEIKLHYDDRKKLIDAVMSIIKKRFKKGK